LNSTFQIFIQLGAVLAVIFFYRADLLHQIRTVRTDATIRRLWFNVLVAFIPAGTVGLVLSDSIKANLLDSSTSSFIVAAALVVGGVVFLLVERRRSPKLSVTDLSQVTSTQAFMIGIAQVSALIPGVSRAGASIVGGLLTGLSRETATRFSFYLAIPTLGTATAFDLLTNLDHVTPTNLAYLLLGTAISAVVALVSMGWLLQYVSRSSFISFGYYRIATGILILLLIVLRVLPG
jgi:undecaprenyl-diphosphatase